MSFRVAPVLLLVLVVVAATQCGPPGAPTLSVSGPTSAYRDGTPITLRVVATRPDGTVGSGQVVVATDVGVVMDERLTLDEFGTAAFTFACNVTTNPDCIIDSAALKLRWQTTPVVTVDYAVRLTPRPSAQDGGSGGGRVCISDRYSRNVCAGTRPDVNVQCCRPGMIPDCNDVYVCDGMKLTRSYVAWPPDGGAAGVPMDLEIEFRIPTYRLPTFSECMMQPVGFVVRRDGVELQSVGFTSYGYIDLTGEYFGLGTIATPTMRPRENRECQYVADGGALGMWHAVQGSFVVPIPGTMRQVEYVPEAPTRFFFQSLLKR